MPFKAAIDRLFQRLGVAATYYPVHGPGMAVTVMPKRPDEVVSGFEARVRTETTILEVRVSEVARPVAGDAIDLGGEVFTVQGEPRRDDPDRLIWTLNTRPA